MGRDGNRPEKPKAKRRFGPPGEDAQVHEAFRANRVAIGEVEHGEGRAEIAPGKGAVLQRAALEDRDTASVQFVPEMGF